MEQSIAKILSKNESLIYCDLLRRGSSKVTDISKRTGIARNKVYDALGRLASKGLVHGEIGKIKRYTASNPSVMADYANKSYANAKATAEEIKTLLPEMQELYDTTKTPIPYFSYTRGKKDILAEIRGEIRQTSSFVYIFARKMTFFEEWKLIDAYKGLVKKGVDVRVITVDEKRARDIAKKMGVKAIFVPQETIFKRTMVVKDNLFAISLYNKDEDIRMKTDSLAIIDAFRSLFLLFWSMKK